MHKLKESVDWLVNHTTADWVLKVDDDTFVRIGSVAGYLRQIEPSEPTVVGRIVSGSKVWKTGKWADVDYNRDKYPLWPMGSCGYVLSRPIMEYISREKNQLHEFQGEDTSVGIWLDESPFKNDIDWHNSRAFINDGNCQDPNALVIGHMISPSKMRRCYMALDETKNLPNHRLDKPFFKG